MITKENCIAMGVMTLDLNNFKIPKSRAYRVSYLHLRIMRGFTDRLWKLLGFFWKTYSALGKTRYFSSEIIVGVNQRLATAIYPEL